MPDAPVPASVSRRISVLRWPACLVVVLVHMLQTFLFTDDFPASTGLLLHLGPSFHWAASCIYGTVVIGIVPLFFLFSGYLHFARPRPYPEALRRRLPRLLVPMALWTAFFCALALAIAPFAGLSPRYDFLFSADPARWFTCLVGDYSAPFEPGICCPTVYQFWYLRDLVVLVLFGPLLRAALRRCPLVFFVLACACAFGGWRPLIVGCNSLLFYSLGAFCGMRKIDFFDLVDRHCPWLPLLLAIAVQAVAIGRGDDPFLDAMPGCFFTVFAFLKASAALVADERRHAFLHRMDRQSFFLYCAHGGSFAGALFLLTAAVLPYERPGMVFLGIVVLFVLDAGFWTGIGLLLERRAPRLFALLTGGRR